MKLGKETVSRIWIRVMGVIRFHSKNIFKQSVGKSTYTYIAWVIRNRLKRINIQQYSGPRQQQLQQHSLGMSCLTIDAVRNSMKLMLVDGQKLCGSNHPVAVFLHIVRNQYPHR